MRCLTIKAVGSLADAASYFEHEMEQDRDRDAPGQDRDPAIDADRDAQQQARDAEQREAEDRERDASEAQERDAREAQERESEARRQQEHEARDAQERDSREHEAREAQEREAEARQREEREKQEREAAQEREAREREAREREDRERAAENEPRGPDTSWQRTGIHAPDEERSQGSPAPLQGWGDDERPGSALHLRVDGVSAEDIWAAQDRFEHRDADALRADLREQYVAAGLTGREADERLDKLEEMVEKAAKLGEHVTITRDDITGELVWSVHNADKAFGNDIERLQFADRLKELEHLATEYGVAFARHDGPEREMQEFARAPNLREEAQARAGLGVDFSIER